MMALASLKPSAFQNYSMIKRRKKLKKPKGRAEESMNGFMEKYTKRGVDQDTNRKKKPTKPTKNNTNKQSFPPQSSPPKIKIHVREIGWVVEGKKEKTRQNKNVSVQQKHYNQFLFVLSFL
jgi:hypothetical protein